MFKISVLRKYILLFIFLPACLAFNAQKAFDFNNDEFKNILKTETIKVNLTGDDAFDAKLMAAFKSYWNISKFEFLTQNQKAKMEQGKDYKVEFMFANFKAESYNLAFSKFIVMIHLNKSKSYKMFEIAFDDMKDTKSGVMEGADRTKEAILNKIAPYIALANAQLKKQIQLGNREYSKYRGETELVKNRKVFIQEEYFMNNLDSSLLNKLSHKVEIMDLKQITSVIDDKNNIGSQAWLCFVTSPIDMTAFIVDLKTGDLLNYAKLEKVETPKKTLSDKSIAKLIKEFNKE